MAILSNVNGKFAVDSTGAIQFSGSAGTSGYILRSNGNAAPTWVDSSTVIGGPYLPLTGGTLSGALAGTSATFSGTITSGGTIYSTLDSTFSTDGSISKNSVVGLVIRGVAGSVFDLALYGAGGTALMTNSTGTNNIVFNSGNVTVAGNVTLNTNGTNFTHGYSGNGLVLSHHNVGPSNAIVSGNSVYPDNLYINNGGAASDWSNVIIEGNVGIGTSSPSSFSGYTNLSLKAGSTGNNLDFFNSAGTRIGAIVTDGSDDVILEASGLSRNLIFKTDNAGTFSEKMRILGNGNVGIGVTGPTEKLEISGKVKINSPNAPNSFGELNIGWTGGGETRAIDIDGNWTGNENKSITFTHGSAATNIVGQINCQHNGPGSRLRWGKLYHSGDSSTYTMELISSSTTTADLTVSGNVGITAAASFRFNGAADNTHAVGYDSTIDGSFLRGQLGMRFLTGTGGGTERMRITSGGNLLVGRTTIAASDNETGFRFDPTGEAFAFLDPAEGTNSWHVYDITNDLYRFFVSDEGKIHATFTSITAISDVTLKENIKPLETGLNEVMKLQPRRFDWKNGDGKNIAGFVAQEVEEILPDLVGDYKYNDKETKKSLMMGDMIPTLVKAIQELEARIKELENK